MKYSKRKLIACGVLFMMCLALFLTGCTSISEQNGGGGSYNMKVTDATSDFYVNDFAGVFTAEQKTAMMANAVSLDQKYGGIQVVVTTVESLNGCVKEKSALQSVNVETVAYSMFLQYGIGQDDMGILVLFSTGDREVRIETGKQMQNYITDSKSGQLLDDYGMDYFRNDQFADGLVAVQNAVISEIKSVVPQDWNAGKAEEVTRGGAVAPTEPVKNDNPVPAETHPVKEQPVKNQPVTGANEAKPEAEKSNGILGGIMTAIVIAIFSVIAFLLAICVSASKLTVVKNQLEESEKELANQKKKHESEINALKSQHEQEMEDKIRQLDLRQNSALKAQSDEAERRIEGLRSLAESKDNQIAKKKQELFDKSKRILTLEDQLATLQDKFARAKKLHPDCDFEAEIKQMIEDEFKAEAQKTDARIAECIDLPADKDRVNVFANALSIYDAVKPEVAKYLKTDVAKLKKLFDESVRLQEQYEKAQKEKRERAAAQKAYEEIQPMVEGITSGTYQNYDVLNRAVNRYNKLSHSEKGYFPNLDLMRRVEVFLKNATEDKNNRDKAKSAESEIQRTLGYMHSGSESDRDKLNRAMNTYKQLSYAQQAYFAADLLSKLKRLIDEAEADHRRQEDRRRREAEERRRREEEARRQREAEDRRRREEEARRRREREEAERRRRMASSSSSSFHHSSSFGGHGGRPSGGGASRRF